MKRSLLLTAYLLMSVFSLHAQVTQVNNNKSLEVIFPFNATKAVVVSQIDSSIWTTDASLAGTVQLVTTVKYEAFGQMLSGKFIFRGSTPATGSEVYAYDGTTVALVSDINPGLPASAPGPMALLNGFLYFSAERPAEGRELWRTNGTSAGTTLVKDIDGTAANSFPDDNFGLDPIYSNGSYLLFAAHTTASGTELWRSDGTGAGTVLLKEINIGHANADSSNPRDFFPYNNLALFAATDATHGDEIWRTDGTAGGTFMLSDINPGTASSTAVELFPGFTAPFFFGFHIFKNHAYFQANDGTNTGEVWSTDGTIANTILVKTIVAGPGLSFAFVIDAVNFPDKFIFPVSDGLSGTRSELWQSDGTPGGTVLFKSFTPVEEADIPAVYIPFTADLSSGTFSQALFQGNKFFFSARTPTAGRELWISDGTSGGTHVVSDINPGPGDGVDSTNTGTYLYTSNALFFAANDGTHGNELWKTDGSDAGTAMVKDINPNAGDADPALSFVFNRKIIFTATDGDDPDHRDLFVVDGNFDPLPVKLTDFIVALKTNDALLQWHTAQEINTKNFTIQRSYDAQHFEDIGTVQASGTAATRHGYSFTDPGITNSGKTMVYYKLLTTDKDGKFENSNVISLKLKGSVQWNVKLLSNPVRDNVNIMLSGISGNLQLSIRDINGRTLYTKSLQSTNGQITLPVVLQKGVYILDAETNNERKSVKFVK